MREKPAQARRAPYRCVVSGCRRFLKGSSSIMTDVVDGCGTDLATAGPGSILLLISTHCQGPV